MTTWALQWVHQVAHVVPVADVVAHDLTAECVCGPRVEYADPETGRAYNGAVVVHHSADGREADE